MGSRRELLVFVTLAAAVRALVTWRTVMPSRDGATYLWMAERVAAGDLGGAFRTVFHPAYPLLTGACLALFPSLPPMLAGQLVGLVCGALAVWPLWLMTAHCFGAWEARLAATFYAFGLWFARYPAECHSEGCFYAAVTLWGWALLGARVRPAWAGVAVAAAYATRPEGLALLFLGWLRLHLGERAGRARFLAVAVLVGACVPLGYAAFGSGFTLTPKAAFNYDEGVGSADSPVGHYVQHALRVPGSALGAIGYLTLPLALAGLWSLRRARKLAWSAPALWLAAPLALQAVVVPLLRSHARFLSGFGVLLLPLAAVASVWLVRGRTARLLATMLVLLPDLLRLPLRRGGDRVVERDLGTWLQPRLRPGEIIATEMPRLEYFAGLQPGPPRTITRDELLRAAALPEARFAVIVARRSRIAAIDLENLGLRVVSLPESISTLVRERDLLVYERN